MKPGSPLARSPLKRSRPKPRPSLQGFWEAVTDHGTAPCALAHLGGCYGRLEAHHHIRKSRLKDDPAAYVDERNGTALCSRHHELVTNARVVCPRPPDLDGFLADYGLYERRAS